MKNRTPPPAPKVPKHGNLAANGTDRSDRLVQLQLGGGATGCQKWVPRCGTWHVLLIGTPCEPFRFDMQKLGANFGPAWLQHTATWPQLQPIYKQLRPKLRSTWLQNRGHSRPNPKSAKHQFSPRFSTTFATFQASCVSVGPNLVCRQRVPSCATLDVTWISCASHGFNLRSFSPPIFTPAWAPIGSKIAQLRSKLSPYGATQRCGPKLEPSAQVGPSWALGFWLG